MWNDNTFWLIFNELAYNTKLVLIIPELRIVYGFKKLQTKHQKDMQFEIFLKNCKSVRNYMAVLHCTVNRTIICQKETSISKIISNSPLEGLIQLQCAYSAHLFITETREKPEDVINSLISQASFSFISVLHLLHNDFVAAEMIIFTLRDSRCKNSSDLIGPMECN